MTNVVPIKEEPTYKVSDIVTTVQLAVDVGGGKMSLTTHVPNVDGVDALKTKLDEMTAASDWVSAKYGLRNLRLQLEQEQKAVVDFREQRESYLHRAGTEWTEIAKRRGDLKLTANQQSQLSNYDNSINSRLQVIEKLKKDIAITEKILAGFA